MTVLPENRNGNAGRQYYACVNEDCPTTIVSPISRGLVSWADGVGMNSNNPNCFCKIPSRQDRVGKETTGKRGLGFWSCAGGDCEYYSEDRYGRPRGETEVEKFHGSHRKFVPSVWRAQLERMRSQIVQLQSLQIVSVSTFMTVL